MKSRHQRVSRVPSSPKLDGLTAECLAVRARAICVGREPFRPHEPLGAHNSHDLVRSRADCCVPVAAHLAGPQTGCDKAAAPNRPSASAGEVPGNPAAQA